MSSNLTFGNVPVSYDHVMQLYRMAWHYTIRQCHMKPYDEDVRDVVQEAVAYTAARMSRGLYDPARGAWSSWAYMYVKSKCISLIGQLYSMRANQADYSVDWLSIPADEHDEPIDEDEYVATLPEKYQGLAGRLLNGDKLVDIAKDEHVTHQAIFARKMHLGNWIRGKQDGD